MQNMLDEWDLVEYFEGILRSLNVNDNVQDLINGTAAQIVDDVERQVQLRYGMAELFMNHLELNIESLRDDDLFIKLLDEISALHQSDIAKD